MYQRPYNIEEIKLHYPDKADFLLNDAVHCWRAESGIELIHEEPNAEEQIRIWKNWNEMTAEQKKISDDKSAELFGMSNEEHHKSIIGKK